MTEKHSPNEAPHVGAGGWSLMAYTSTLLVLTGSVTGAQSLVERVVDATETDAARLRRQYPWPYYIVVEEREAR